MVLPAAARGGVEQHVGRLHVAVHQPARVRRVQCRPHLGDDVDDPRGGQRALGVEQCADVRAVHEPHRDEQDAVRLAGVEHRNDVGVVDGRRDPRFADEPFPERIVGRQPGSQDLQRDIPVKPGFMSAEDDRHPAAAYLLLEPIASNLRANRELAECLRKLVAHPPSSNHPRRYPKPGPNGTLRSGLFWACPAQTGDYLRHVALQLGDDDRAGDLVKYTGTCGPHAGLGSQPGGWPVLQHRPQPGIGHSD